MVYGEAYGLSSPGENWRLKADEQGWVGGKATAWSRRGTKGGL